VAASESGTPLAKDRVSKRNALVLRSATHHGNELLLKAAARTLKQRRDASGFIHIALFKSCGTHRGPSSGVKMRNHLFAIVALVLSLNAFADESGLLDANAGILTKASKYSASDTMDRVEAAAKSVGANIFARIDYQQMSKKVNVDIRPNQLLLFGRGAGAPYIIKEAPLAGLDLPFKALVWEDSQGKVWVSHTNGSFIDKRYAVKGAASYVKNIDETIEKIVSEALK
jgi:uncharacterized protein (DUF302 family)